MSGQMPCALRGLPRGPGAALTLGSASPQPENTKEIMHVRRGSAPERWCFGRSRGLAGRTGAFVPLSREEKQGDLGSCETESPG